MTPWNQYSVGEITGETRDSHHGTGSIEGSIIQQAGRDVNLPWLAIKRGKRHDNSVETTHKESNEIDEQLNSDHVHSLTNSQHISFRFGKDTQAMRQAYRYVPAA